MNITAIRSLVESDVSDDELRIAEADLLEERKPCIDIIGDDDGERLTHVMAALWVRAYQRETNSETMSAIREYTKKVRSSIS